MKRTGLTFVAALCLAATSFAAGNQPGQSEKPVGMLKLHS